jgi:hypothetical protein
MTTMMVMVRVLVVKKEGYSARSFICCRISLDSPHPTLLPPAAAADVPTFQ